MFIKKSKNIQFKLFEPVKIQILMDLSQIDPDYIDSEEDIESGSIMELCGNPNAVYLERSSVVYISNFDNVDFIEGIHFKFI